MKDKIVVIDFAGTLIKAEIIEEANKLQMKDKRRKKKILNKHKIIHKKTEEENKTKVKLEIIDI